MIASRKIRTFAFAGLAAALLVGLASASAEAGHGHRRHHGHHGHFGHHVTFKHVNHGHLHHVPLIKYVTQAYTYPVIVLDCYGHPTTIWKTGFRTVPIRIYR